MLARTQVDVDIDIDKIPPYVRESIMNYHHLKKKNRPLTPVEQAGMSNLLSGLKKSRDLATEKACLASIRPDGDVFGSQPIQGLGEHS